MEQSPRAGVNAASSARSQTELATLRWPSGQPLIVTQSLGAGPPQAERMGDCPIHRTVRRPQVHRFRCLIGVTSRRLRPLGLRAGAGGVGAVGAFGWTEPHGLPANAVSAMSAQVSANAESAKRIQIPAFPERLTISLSGSGEAFDPPVEQTLAWLQSAGAPTEKGQHAGRSLPALLIEFHPDRQAFRSPPCEDLTLGGADERLFDSV